MTPLWLIACGGLLGSAHCVGMCGGFALLLGMRQQSAWRNLRVQLVYSAGRLVSYGSMGAIAGFSGRQLAERLSSFVNVPAVLCLISGVFLLWEGLHAAGLLKRSHAGTGCLLSPLLTTMLKSPGWRNTFTAGLFTGLLPCGLVYAFVSLAASAGDLLNGLIIMIAFGIGTIPLMVLTGVGSMLLGIATRKRLWQAAAWSVMLTGLLTCCRGITFLQANDIPPAKRCPFCTARGNSE